MNRPAVRPEFAGIFVIEAFAQIVLRWQDGDSHGFLRHGALVRGVAGGSNTDVAPHHTGPTANDNPQAEAA